MMQLFFSCAEEKEFVNDRNLKEINLKRQPFEEVLKSPIFNTAFQKVVNRKINFTQSEVARTALEDAHGFTIVEDYPVNILNYDNYTTYSLLIKSDGEKKIGFENLLIRVDSLNRTVATIINYKTSQEDFSNLAPSFFQTVEKEVKPLIENDAVVQPEDADKITTEHCLNYLIPMCTIHGGNIDYDHVFINSNSCIVSYYTLQEICFTTTVFGGAGGNETSSGNSSPGGNTGGNTGGGSTNNNNGLGASGGAIPNAPVLPCVNCIEEDGEINHIKELKKLSSNSLIKQKINNYRAKLTTKRKEEGIILNPLGTINDTIAGVSLKNSTKFNNVPASYCVNIHMHQNLYYPGYTTTLTPTNPIPSDVDVLQLSLSAFRFNNNPNNTSIIVSRLGTFAIRITDTSKALAAINALDPDGNINTLDGLQQEFINNYDINVQDIFETGEEADALQAFINFINTNLVNGQTMGLGIFQATFNSSGNAITTWVQL